MAIDYDPFSTESWSDPYLHYQTLRDEAPIFFAPASKTYCISRFEDVEFAFKHPEIFSSKSMFVQLLQHRWTGLGVQDVFEALRFLVRARVNIFKLKRGGFGTLITTDPPEHTALRNTVMRAFAPRRMQVLETRISEIVEQRTRKLWSSEHFDLMQELAIPLPVTVIAEMLGVEPERRQDFRRWTHALIQGISGSQRTEPVGSFLNALGELLAYLRPVVAQRRADPADDLISVLVDPRHGETLDEPRVLFFVVLLLIAGSETTTNLIGNAVVALLNHPDALERIHADHQLIPALVEETLRYESPVQMTPRRTLQEIEMHGVRIPEGADVAVLNGSANRDERMFDDPNRFDIGRDTTGHIAFGKGIHFCLGAALARLEACIALKALLPHIAELTLAEQHVPLIDSYVVRGPRRLLLTQKPRIRVAI